MRNRLLLAMSFAVGVFPLTSGADPGTGQPLPPAAQLPATSGNGPTTSGVPQNPYPDDSSLPPSAAYPALRGAAQVPAGRADPNDATAYPADEAGIGYTDMNNPNEVAYDANADYDVRVDDPSANVSSAGYSQSGYYVDDGYDAEAYTDFYQPLSDYGSWGSEPGYGMVWSPSSTIVGAGFSPYATGGHWALTEYGWTWVSDWDWGWAPFHYGRWVTSGSRGWCWVPGRVWGPAWVNWRYGGGYVGWAPMAPRWAHVPPPAPGGATPWRFTTTHGLMAARPQFVPSPQARSVFAATAPIRNVQRLNNFRVEAGPNPHVIAGAIGRPLTPVSVRNFAAATPRTNIVARPAISLRPAPSPPPLRAYPGQGAIGAAPPRPGGSAGASPAIRAPSYGSPGVRPQAAAASPVYRAPAYSAPTYRAPAPTYSPPVYRSQPTYSPPVYHSQPSYSPPVYRSPAPSYSPPVYHSQPSYSPPAYHSQPSYSPPAFHSAPSYAPSYHAPSGGGWGGGGARRR